jgi:hypothetical protein
LFWKISWNTGRRSWLASLGSTEAAMFVQPILISKIKEMEFMHDAEFPTIGIPVLDSLGFLRRPSENTRIRKWDTVCKQVKDNKFIVIYESGS